MWNLIQLRSSSGHFQRNSQTTTTPLGQRTMNTQFHVSDPIVQHNNIFQPRLNTIFVVAKKKLSKQFDLVALLSGNAFNTTNGPHDDPPTRPSLLFLDKCVTERCILFAPGSTMGRAWDNSAIHRGLFSGVSEMDKRQTHVFFPSRWIGGISNHSMDDAARVGLQARSGAFFIAATADWNQRTRLKQYGHCATWRICVGLFRMQAKVFMAQLSMPTSFTVATLMLGKSSMKDAVASSFAWNWSYTPVLEVPRDVRGATAQDDRTPLSMKLRR